MKKSLDSRPRCTSLLRGSRKTVTCCVVPLLGGWRTHHLAAHIMSSVLPPHPVVEYGMSRKKLVEHARKNNVILGLFLFGTSRVGEFLEKGFTFISIGNDLHHVLTQAGAYVADMENIAKENGKSWKRRSTALF